MKRFQTFLAIILTLNLLFAPVGSSYAAEPPATPGAAGEEVTATPPSESERVPAPEDAPAQEYAVEPSVDSGPDLNAQPAGDSLDEPAQEAANESGEDSVVEPPAASIQSDGTVGDSSVQTADQQVPEEIEDLPVSLASTGGAIITVSSEDPTIADRMPLGATWEVYELDAWELIAYGEFQGDDLLLDSVIPGTDSLPFGDYYVQVVAIAPAFSWGYTEFTIDSMDLTPVSLVLHLASGVVTVNLSSTYPEVASVLPADSTWRITDYTGVETVATGDFGDQPLDLVNPVSIELPNLMPRYTTYILEVSPSSTFAPFNTSFFMSNPRQSVDVPLAPMGGMVTVAVSSDDVDIVDELPDSVGWYISNMVTGQIIDEGSFDGAGLEHGSVTLFTGTLPLGEYYIQIDGVGPFAFTYDFFTIDSIESKTIDIDLPLRVGLVTVNLSSTHPDEAYELPANSTWRITYSATGDEAASGNFGSGTINLAAPVPIELPDLLDRNHSYTLEVDAGAGFGPFSTEFYMSGTRESVDVPLAPMGGTVTITVYSSDVDIVDEWPGSVGWYISNTVTEQVVAGGTFDGADLEQGFMILFTGALPFGEYYVQIDGVEPFEYTYTDFTVYDREPQWVAFDLPLRVGLLTVNLSSTHPDVVYELPANSTWRILDDLGAEVANGDFGDSPLDLRTHPPIELPKLLAGGSNYTLEIDAGAGFRLFSASFYVGGGRLSLNVPLSPIGGTVTITVSSADPMIAHIMPPGSSWQVYDFETGALVDSGTFVGDDLELPSEISLSALPYGDFEVYIHASPEFMPGYLTLRVTNAEHQDRSVTLTPTSGEITLQLYSTHPDIANTLPDGSTWKLVDPSDESIVYKTGAIPGPVTMDEGEPSGLSVDIGLIPFGQYGLIVDAGPGWFHAQMSLISHWNSHSTYNVALAPMGGELTISIRSADQAVAPSLPAGAQWEIAGSGGFLVVGDFEEEQLLPTQIPYTGALPYGSIYVRVFGEPTFSYGYEHFLNELEGNQNVDVTMQLVHGQITLNLSTTNSGVAHVLPAGSTWQLWDESVWPVVQVASGDFGDDPLDLIELPTFTLPGIHAVNHSYRLEIDAGEDYAPVLHWFHMATHQHSESVALVPRHGRVSITVQSDTEFGVPLYLPGNATWEIRQNGETIDSGVFAPDEYGNLQLLPAPIPFDGLLTEGEYDLIVSPGPSFEPHSGSFTVVAGEVTSHDATLTAIVGTVALTLTSNGPFANHTFGPGSIIKVWDASGYPYWYGILLEGEQLPLTLDVPPLLYGEYYLTVNTNNVFEIAEVTFAVNSPNKQIDIDLIPQVLPATVTLVTTEGLGGSSVRVQGTGFDASEMADFRWGSADGPLLRTYLTTTNGKVNNVVVVPIVASGQYEIHVTGQTSGATGSAVFTITGRMPATVTLVETEGLGGSSVRVQGTRFDESELADFRWGSADGPLLRTYLTTTNGKVNNVVVVPIVAPGDYEIHVTGQTSGATGSAVYTVTGRMPATVTLVETEGLGGSSVRVQGTRFDESELADFRWGSADGPLLRTYLTTTNGKVNNVVVVPIVPPGQYEIHVTGQTSGATGSAVYTVTGRMPATVALVTTEGLGGSSVRVQGTRFDESELADFRWGSANGPLLRTYLTTTNGKVNNVVVVPIVAPGEYEIHVTGQTSGATGSAIFTVLPPPEVAMFVLASEQAGTSTTPTLLRVGAMPEPYAWR